MLSKSYINKKNAKLILEWCFKYFGWRKKNKPSIWFFSNAPKFSAIKECRGIYYYDSKKIYINKKTQHDFLDFIGTVLHEYKHHWQPSNPSSGDECLTDEEKVHLNEKEREAESFEKRYRKKCYNELKDVFLK